MELQAKPHLQSEAKENKLKNVISNRYKHSIHFYFFIFVKFFLGVSEQTSKFLTSCPMSTTTPEQSRPSTTGSSLGEL